MEALLKTHNISSKTGYIPEILKPLSKNFWINLQALIRRGDVSTFQEDIRHFFDITEEEALEVINVTSLEEAYSIYSLISFIVAKYVWLEPTKPIEVLPKYLGFCYLQICKYVGINPAMTHAAVNLFNWKVKDDTIENKYSIENLDINYTILLNDASENNIQEIETEKWFYLIHIAFELNSGSSVKNVTDIILNNKNMSDKEMIFNLNQIADSINKAVEIVSRIGEHCNNRIFFEKLRNYLSGWDKLPQKHLEAYNGEYYEKLEYKGGSAAQSSLIQTWDILLGVNHVQHAKDFFAEMRNYMPYSHMCFLNTLESYSFDLNEYIKNRKNQELVQAYNECVASLIELRTMHKGIIHNYIVKFVPALEERRDINEQIVDTINGGHGSGGTLPIPFVNTIIWSTRKQFIDFIDTGGRQLLWHFIQAFILSYLIYYFLY